MAKRLQMYQCQTCGHMVMVFHDGAGELVCCNQPMKLLVENTTDAAKEKHVPVIEKTDQGVVVKVGSVPHPMIENHFIEWVEVLADDRLYCKFLEPGAAPEATFLLDATGPLTAREHCNLHGYWKG